MPEAHAAKREEQILDLWERAVGLGSWRRDDALLSESASGESLGDRNMALLELRNSIFSNAWPLRSCCPTCANEAEFHIDSFQLLENLRQRNEGEPASFQWRELQLTARAPTVSDMRAISGLADELTAERALLLRCISGDGFAERVGDGDVELLSQHIEAIDPAAVISFDVTCSDCGHRWSAAVDVGEAVWLELQRAAEQSLVEIVALARAFGWTERDVLNLSAVRRAAYLQFAEVS